MSENLISLLLSAAEPVSWLLIHSIWVGGLLALMLAATMALFKNGKSQVRYAAACATLLLIIPLSFSVTLFTTDIDGRQPLALNEAGSASTVSPVSNDATARTVNEGSLTTGIADALTPYQLSMMPWVFTVWLLGVSLLSIYHALGWRRAKRLLRLGSVSVSPEWETRFTHLCRRVGLARTIQIVRSPFLNVPCVVGWIKPTVLVPVSLFTGMSADDLEMILAHELAHVRRHDVLINYLQTALETVLFFNPAVWWISRQIRIEREHCCDDLAVAISGDRLSFARALTQLERLRSPQPRLAPAANGAPLLKRVGRLVGTRTSVGRWPGFSVVGALSLATALLITLTAMGTFSPTVANAETQTVVAGEYIEQDDDLHGEWEIEPQRRGRLQLRLRFSRRGESSFSVRPQQLVGLSEGDDVRFQLVRDAGTFFLEGSVEVDGEDYYGDGICHFRGNEDYVDKMEGLEYRIKSNRKLFELALHDVELDFVQGLADLGYRGMGIDKLIELHIHRVTPKYVKELADLGYRDLSPDRLVEMRIHRVTPEYIAELNKSGYGKIRPSKLVEMMIHRVDPDYINGLAEHGYTNIDPSKLVEMSIHRVSPDYVGRLAELGYGDLSPSKLVEMSIHRVDPGYIEDLIELGYDNISPSKLVEMRIHNVGIGYIQRLKELGYENVDPSDLVAMRIHNVSTDFIEDLQEDGYDNLSPDDLIEYKINGRSRSNDWWD